MTQLDPRQDAFDPQSRFAEVRLHVPLLADQPDIDWRFVAPQRIINGNRRLSLRARPDAESPQVTEALAGEALERLWEENDWVRVRTVHDGYLGWAAREALDIFGQPELELQVTALRAHAFAGPKVSQPIVAELSFGARMARGAGEVVEEGQRRWVPVVLPSGLEAWVQEVCFAPLAESEMAAFALRFLETPYVWGGRSAWGLDCSGLTQLVYAAYGKALPRDADQQEAALGKVETPQAGDLAFFEGHVGLMLDERRMVHANATYMRVTVETLGEGAYGKRLAGGLRGFGRLP